jgi:ClpX C4-type zinc finger.
MRKVTKPPVLLNGCRVEQFAIRDRSIKFRGHGLLFSDDREVGPVPRLALARDKNEEVVLLHCDARWQVLGISGGHATVREAKRAAERFYTGISKRWIPTGYTKTDARHALDRVAGPKKCAVCLRSPYDVDAMVEMKKRKLAICDECIRELYGLLSSASDV